MHTCELSTNPIVKTLLPESNFSSLLPLVANAQEGDEIKLEKRSTYLEHITYISFTLHIDFLKLLRVVNVTTNDEIDEIKKRVNDFLPDDVDLSFFHIIRIDYCNNFVISSYAERKLLFDTIKKSSTKCNYLKSEEDYDLGVYWKNNSRHFQIYDKNHERSAKPDSHGNHLPIEPWEKNVVRKEMQLLRGHIKGKTNKEGIAKDFDTWVNLRREADYLSKSNSFIPKGDFWSLKRAIEIVNSAPEKVDGKEKYTESIKEKLINLLTVTAEGGLDAAKATVSRNTRKKYIALLSDLDVNVLTIPLNNKGIEHLENFIFCEKPAPVPAIPKKK